MNWLTNVVRWLMTLLPRVPDKPQLPAPVPPIPPTPAPVPPAPISPAPQPPVYIPQIPQPPTPPVQPPAPKAQSIIQGIDISQWQGHINYDAVKAAGIVFTVMKATEGVGFVDPLFDENFRNSAGFEHRGVYHFARPDLGNSPEAEADYFCMIVGHRLVPGDFVALDIEVGSGNLLEWCLRWLRRVYNNLGFRPMIYSYWSFFTNHGIDNNAELAQYGLWLADWNIPVPPVVPGWLFIAIWQKSNSGSVPGVPARVDLDEFEGDEMMLTRYGKP